MMKIKNKEFIEIILNLLKPIGEIKLQATENNITCLYKSNIIFGLIIDNNLFLRANLKNQKFNAFQENIVFQGKEYCKLDKQFLINEHNQDIIIQIATQAYWLASGKLKS